MTPRKKIWGGNGLIPSETILLRKWILAIRDRIIRAHSRGINILEFPAVKINK
jgi:hypothetical protein